MKKQIKYTQGPIDEVGIVPDFLPPPSALVPKEELEKVTIALSKSSVDFFREQARKNGTQYQRMIRALLDRYVDLQSAREQRKVGEP